MLTFMQVKQFRLTCLRVKIMTEIAEIGDYVEYDGKAGTILQEGETFTDSGFAGSQFRSNSGTAINVMITGKKWIIKNGRFAIRVKIEAVGDCEPSSFWGGYLFKNNENKG